MVENTEIRHSYIIIHSLLSFIHYFIWKVGARLGWGQQVGTSGEIQHSAFYLWVVCPPDPLCGHRESIFVLISHRELTTNGCFYSFCGCHATMQSFLHSSVSCFDVIKSTWSLPSGNFQFNEGVWYCDVVELVLEKHQWEMVWIRLGPAETWKISKWEDILSVVLQAAWGTPPVVLQNCLLRDLLFYYFFLQTIFYLVTHQLKAVWVASIFRLLWIMLQ